MNVYLRSPYIRWGSLNSWNHWLLKVYGNWCDVDAECDRARNTVWLVSQLQARNNRHGGSCQSSTNPEQCALHCQHRLQRLCQQLLLESSPEEAVQLWPVPSPCTGICPTISGCKIQSFRFKFLGMVTRSDLNALVHLMNNQYSVNQ